jgi:iron complex transport system ATP-binding protein
MTAGLCVRQLSASYGACTILHALSLHDIARGKVTALLGPNGSGKSTLLKALAGLIRTSGDIALDGRDITHASFAERARHVVYLPQSLPASVHLTVLESVLVAGNASTGRRNGGQDTDAVFDLLRRLGIEHLGMHYLDQLSGGQRQLVGLAQALIRQPALLLLDEPLSALDLNYQFHVMDLIRSETVSRNMVTVIVLHDINIALRHADHAVVIRDGRLLGSGAPGDAITPDLLSAAYGVRGRIEKCSRGIPHLSVDGLAT